MSMISSVQEKLLNSVDEHFLSYYEAWERSRIAFTRSTFSSERRMAQEAIISQFQQYGVEPLLFGTDHPLLYGERSQDTFSTLLLYYSYAMGASPLQQAELLAACTAALDIYQHAIGSPPINIKWLFDSGTEGAIGESELWRLLEEHRELLRADGCLWWGAGSTDDTPPFLALGSKGFLCVELAVQTTSTPFHSRYGAILPNAAWRLTWALSSLKSPGEEVLIEGFYDTLTPAEDDEIELISALPDKRLALQQDSQHLLMGLQGMQLNYALLLTPTCTINGMNSGSIAQVQPFHRAYTHAVMPFQAKALVDFHLVPGQEPADILSKLQHHLQTQGFQDVQTHLIYESLPTRTPLNDPFVQTVLSAATTTYGPALRLLPLIDANHSLAPFRQVLGLPVVLTATGCSAHEYGQRDQFVAYVKLITLLIEELGNYATDRK
jgi:acetylornithine deacetylase/succinyl-diaminopimelate desuccinylase-like protein